MAAMAVVPAVLLGDVEVITEAQFLRELMAYISVFQSDIRIKMSRKDGLSIVTMDSSHITLITCEIKPQGMKHYRWHRDLPPTGTDDFDVAITVPEWKRILGIFAATCPHVRLWFGRNVDTTRVEFGTLVNNDKAGGAATPAATASPAFRVVHHVVLKNINLSSDTLGVCMPDSQLITLTMDSKMLKREIANRLKLKPDTVSFVFPPDKTDEMLFCCTDRSTQVNTRIALLENTNGKDGDDDKEEEENLIVGWQAGQRISSVTTEALSSEVTAEEDGDNGGGAKRRRKDTGVHLEVRGIDDLDDIMSATLPAAAAAAATVTANSKKRKATETSHVCTDLYSATVVSRIDKSRWPHARVANRGVELIYSPGCLNNVAAGAVFSNRTEMTLCSELVRFVYDMGPRGKITCMLAARLENDDT
jgi:hypothetical protein